MGLVLLVLSLASMVSSRSLSAQEIFDATKRNDLTAVRALLAGDAGLINATNDAENDLSALHYAADSGFVDMAELLLDRGARINARGAEGDTPLYLACRDGHLAIVQLLVEHRTDVNVGSVSISPLHMASRMGYREIAELLIRSGAEVNSRDFWEAMPLHWAAAMGHREVVDLLLRSGAEVNSRDGYNRTPLHLAAFAGEKETVRALLTAGADVSLLNSRRQTASDVALRQKNKGVVEILSKHDQGER